MGAAAAAALRLLSLQRDPLEYRCSLGGSRALEQPWNCHTPLILNRKAACIVFFEVL